MNTKSLFRLSTIAVLTAIVCISCKKEDGNNGTNPSSGNLTCKIDGVTFTASTFANTLIGDPTGKRLDIRGTNAAGEQLIITVNDVDPLGTNFSHLGDTVYVDPFENSPMNLMTLGTLLYPDNTFIMTIGDGKKSGYSIITSCNLSTKKVSGVFEFMLIDFQTDDTTYVTEGKYNNLSF